MYSWIWTCAIQRSRRDEPCPNLNGAVITPYGYLSPLKAMLAAEVLHAVAVHAQEASRVRLDAMGVLEGCLQPLLFVVAQPLIEVANGDGRLREGMTGDARINGPRRSLVWQGLRAASRWVRSQAWL